MQSVLGRRSFVVGAGTRAVLLLATSLAITACSELPNLDDGSAGCQNARGIGPTDGQVPFANELLDRHPAAAAAVARSRGHTVVFNVQLPNYGECWCDTPPMGTVIDAWWGQHGALWLMVDGVDVGHTPEDQPFLGWGCD